MAKAAPPPTPAANDYLRLLESYFEMREEEDRLASARAALAHRLHQARAEQRGREMGEGLGRAAARAEAEGAVASPAKPKAN